MVASDRSLRYHDAGEKGVSTLVSVSLIEDKLKHSNSSFCLGCYSIMHKTDRNAI